MIHNEIRMIFQRGNKKVTTHQEKIKKTRRGKVREATRPKGQRNTVQQSTRKGEAAQQSGA